jgi:hypothetical protein
MGKESEISSQNSNIINEIIDVLEMDKMIADIGSFYEEYIGVRLTVQQAAAELAQMDSDLLTEIAEDAITDTCVREGICEDHAYRFVKMPWPTYGDGEEYTMQFYAALQQAHIEAGYELLGN